MGLEQFYLSDFGITKRAASGPSLTGTGQVLGTVDYIAPEQIEGRPVDRRTNVYALGALIYECLTGQVLFERDHDLAVLLAHLREDPPPPSTVRPDVPAAVDAVLAPGDGEEPNDRSATASEFVEQLRAAPGWRSRRAAAAGVGFQNAAMAPDQRFQAAASYSLRSPPRIGRRRILP